MTGKGRRPPSTKIETLDPDDFITEEQTLLDGYLSGQLTLEQFWTDDGLDRFHVDPLKNVIRRALWLQMTTGHHDSRWWGRLRELIDHAIMREVDKLEKAVPDEPEYQRDVRRFRANLRRTGGCLIWDQLTEVANHGSWGAVERKFESGALLALGKHCSSAFYPIAQFQESGAVIDGVREVHREFDGDVVWSFNFLVETNPRLNGRTPIDCLRDGEKRRVVRLARLAAIE